MRRTVFVLMVSLGASFATIAAAQESGAVYGDWTLKCADAERAAAPGAATDCALVQRLVRPDDQAFAGEVGLNVAETEQGSRVLMVLLTPQGVALDTKPAFAIDPQPGGTQAQLAWRTCASSLCRAVAVLTPEQEAALRAGRVLAIGFRGFRAKRPARLAFSLNGVRDGLAALGAR